jgi:multidrug efflux pump subunit AcrA (membrane-fusion protein)
LIPQRAVSELQRSYQVAEVGPDNTVHIKTVTLGPQIGPDWLITSSINPNERVVTEGMSKLKDGMPVSPQPAARVGDNDGFLLVYFPFFFAIAIPSRWRILQAV